MRFARSAPKYFFAALRVSPPISALFISPIHPKADRRQVQKRIRVSLKVPQRAGRKER
jgi:hypothetical protein